MTRARWRTWVGWFAIVGVVGELAHAPFIEVPLAPILFAVLFAGAWFWIRRGGNGGVIVVLVLSGLELAGFPFYERESTGDWILQVSAAILGTLGVIIAFGALFLGRREESPARNTS